MEYRNTQSPLARAIGLGSAKEGSGHWWAERISAIALVPLTLWLAAALIAHTNSSHAAFIAWLKTPYVTALMILLLIAAVAARAEELPRHSSSPVALPVISIAAILKDFPPL